MSLAINLLINGLSYWLLNALALLLDREGRLFLKLVMNSSDQVDQLRVLRPVLQHFPFVKLVCLVNIRVRHVSHDLYLRLALWEIHWHNHLDVERLRRGEDCERDAQFFCRLGPVDKHSRRIELHQLLNLLHSNHGHGVVLLLLHGHLLATHLHHGLKTHHLLRWALIHLVRLLELLAYDLLTLVLLLVELLRLTLHFLLILLMISLFKYLFG